MEPGELPAELGEVVGGYRLESVLGRGAMGCVYLGAHTLLGRKGAIKILDPKLAYDVEYVNRFFQEARVVNEVHHANIVDVIDFVRTEAPPRVAYIMEHIAGPTLASVLEERRLTLIQALNVAAQLASALEAVHAVGIVHRDLKPANILVLAPLDSDLSAVPAVKIVDFGIAKVTAAQPGFHTATGMVLGTPAYMAPEQISADPVSSKTDVYALGEILHEMIAGERAFDGENMAIFRAKLQAKVEVAPLPRSALERDRLQALITACLSTDPRARPSVAEFARAIASIKAELPTERMPALPPVRKKVDSEAPTALPFTQVSALSLPRYRTLTTVAMLAAGALLALAVVVVYFALQERGTPAIVIEAKDVVVPAPIPAKPAVPVEQPAAIEAEKPVPEPAKPAAKVPRKESVPAKEKGPLKRELPSW